MFLPSGRKPLCTRPLMPVLYSLCNIPLHPACLVVQGAWGRSWLEFLGPCCWEERRLLDHFARVLLFKSCPSTWAPICMQCLMSSHKLGRQQATTIDVKQDAFGLNFVRVFSQENKGKGKKRYAHFSPDSTLL